MIIAFVLLFLLIIFDCRPKVFLKDFNDDYISNTNTLPIKGIFVILVFFNHFKAYVALTSKLDSPFVTILDILGQLIVTLFLFYSGFGIMQSIKKKPNYMKKFMMHRFLPVYVSFAICLLFFLIGNAIIGKHYDLSITLLSFTGWTSIGNSNWFMFVTFVIYILVYISFRFLHNQKNTLYGLLLFTILSIGFVVALALIKDSSESFWYNTILCFTFGMWYGYFLDSKVEKLIKKNNISYLITLFSAIALIIIIHFIIPINEIEFIIRSIIFSFIVILITMKVSFEKSKVLSFFGKHVFSIYILQRLVFRIITNLNLIDNQYLFFIISFGITIGFATLYDYLFNKGRQFLTSKIQLLKSE